MNYPEQMQERLWDYIDGLGTTQERLVVEDLMANQVEWQVAYEKLLELHQLVAGQLLEAPSMRFSKNVMEQIAAYQVAPATRSYLNKGIIWGLGGFFVVVILGLIIYSMTQVRWAVSTGSNTYGVRQLAKKLDWSKYLGSAYTDGLILIIVVFGLVLLDMYLRQRTHPNDQLPG